MSCEHKFCPTDADEIAEAGLLALRERRMRVTKAVSHLAREVLSADTAGLHIGKREGLVPQRREHGESGRCPVVWPY